MLRSSRLAALLTPVSARDLVERLRHTPAQTRGLFSLAWLPATHGVDGERPDAPPDEGGPAERQALPSTSALD